MVGARKLRSRRFAALVVPLLLVISVATTSWAGSVDPTPVKDKAGVTEVAPTAHRAWFGWAQNSQKRQDHYNFYVQRGANARVRVNAPGTQGLGGGIVGHRVYYVGQYLDHDPRINRFDLRTGNRAPLPAKVNHRRHRFDNHPVLSGVRGDVSVSGSWILYSGFMRELGDYPYHTVMLYNRVTHKLRRVSYRWSNWADAFAGQVNGKYVTYVTLDYEGEEAGTESTVERYNIRTRRYVALEPSQPSSLQSRPSVSSDGTVYYFEVEANCDQGPCTYTAELVRRPLKGPSTVIATLASGSPSGTFVKDRHDGSRAIFFSWEGDIYKVVDDAATARVG